MALPLIMLIPYFGRWPEWIELFVESCKWNPDVRWRVFTDCGEPENKAGNVAYFHLSFHGNKGLAARGLRLPWEWAPPHHFSLPKPVVGPIPLAQIAGCRF